MMSNRFRPFMLAWLSLMMLGTGGCGILGPSAGGSFRIQSIDLDPAMQITGEVRTAVFEMHDPNTATIILSDLALEDLIAGRFDQDGQVVCVEMLWRPKAGMTPMDRTATNGTVRQVIFVEEEAGVYEGAGFIDPGRGQLKRHLAGEVANVNMRLIANSESFVDRIRVGRYTSSFSAVRNDDAVTAMTAQLNAETSRRLGRLFYVAGN